MTLAVEDCLAAIESHTRGLAAAAEGNLDARIEHCPDWSMADLVWHLAQVHWFWNHVASVLPTDAPEDAARPDRPDDEALIATLLGNMATMVDTLRAADQAAPCWTWGLEENVGFITRHQVQEAAVHHWDAAHAVGGAWSMDGGVAMDAVDEFLTHSVANNRWPVAEAEPLDGQLQLCGWTVVDGEPGMLSRTSGHGGGGPTVSTDASAVDVLLWLYRRLPDESLMWDGDAGLLARFRAFTSTD